VRAYERDKKVCRKDEGQKDRHRGKRSRNDGTHHLVRSSHNRFFARYFVYDVTIDVLYNHNAVIHQHADCQSHSNERKAIYGNIVSVKEVESCKYRDRNRKRDGQNKFHTAKKDP
jgi:hypothetical protein